LESSDTPGFDRTRRSFVTTLAYESDASRAESTEVVGASEVRGVGDGDCASGTVGVGDGDCASGTVGVAAVGLATVEGQRDQRTREAVGCGNWESAR